MKLLSLIFGKQKKSSLTSAVKFIDGVSKAQKKKASKASKSIRLAGDEAFGQEIVGERNYQVSLLALCGGKKTADGVEVEKTATLVCEDTNPHDSMAVAVFIDRKKVGYLSREIAREYRNELRQIAPELPNTKVSALIVGGWLNKESEGHFGVQLDLAWPLETSDE